MPVSQAPRKKQSERSSKAKKAAKEAEHIAATKSDRTPLYIPVATFTFIIVGIIIIILNFLSLLPGDQQSQYSIIGVALLSFGLVSATQIK